MEKKLSMELGLPSQPIIPRISAGVPGIVQNDLMRAGWIPDYNIGLRSLDIEWVNNRDWVYEKSFHIPLEWVKDRCELVFEGLDYSGEIYLNGCKLFQFEGMFKPVIIFKERIVVEG